MSRSEIPRPRVGRVPLENLKLQDWLRRWKGRLSWFLPAAVAIAVVLLLLCRGDGGTAVYTPRGPLTAVHASWETECSACHTPLSPIQPGSWTASLLTAGPVSNDRCQTCHAGPVHHGKQHPAIGCAECHREHQGRGASLLDLADQNCVRCHANLAAHHTVPKEMDKWGNVSGFAPGQHPEFSLVEKAASGQELDPGKIKFNHALHMTAGMRLASGSKPFTLEDVANEDRERYSAGQADQDPKAPVQLSCASCHVGDSRDLKLPHERLQGLPVRAIKPSRGNGDYMLPIIYEVQCRACHPLTFDRDGNNNLVAVPHRLQPPELRKFLEGFYANRLLEDTPPALEDALIRIPLPGKGLDPAPRPQARQWIQDKVSVAARELFQGKRACGECHYEERSSGISPADPFPTRIKPAHIPDLWFLHARFSHEAHVALDCRHCHERAYPDHPQASGKRDVEAWRSHEDVLLPGIANCQQCHAPRSQTPGTPAGGARFACVECHRYHNGDAPRQGLGAAARGVPQGARLDAASFLHGERHP